MEKFSLYDFLAIILPGIAFIVVFRIIFSSLHLSLPVDIPLGLESTIVYALICGAVLYVLSFSLVKLFPRLFGLYRHVADLYQKMKALHPIMNDTLNRQAERWGLGKIYLSEEEFCQSEEKEKIRMLQSDFYDRMWYRLDFRGKLGSAKSFQCYYFFFRHSFWGLVLISLILLSYKLLAYIPACDMEDIGWREYSNIAVPIMILSALFVFLAQWFRIKMVEKMYWTFYISLIEQENSNL